MSNSTFDLVAYGRVHRVIYPKGQLHPGDFAVFVLQCSKINGEIDPRIKDQWYKEGFLKFSGTVPELCNCTDYKISAKLKHHPQYGWSYEVSSMNIDADFSTPESTRKFLSYILSDQQIEALCSTYSNPVALLKNGDVNDLCKVKGIGPATAEKMIAKYQASADNSNAYAFLFDYGVSKNLADRIIKTYGSPLATINKISENPYCIIEDVHGVGWSTADAMAQKKGCPSDSPYRLRAFTNYYLRTLANTDGHTWVTVSELVTNLSGLVVGLAMDRIKTCIQDMIASKILYYDPERKRIGLYSYRVLEEQIYIELMRLVKAPKNDRILPTDEIEKVILECEMNVGFKYSEEQRKIIYEMVDKNVFLLTGGAGVGKSTLMYPVSRIFKQSGLKVNLCALSGKASLNLSDITHEEGSTIHRLLGIKKGGRATFRKGAPMPADVIILDELSMVGGELFYSLIQAIKDGAKLIMLGDPGQLEAIGLCNLISDIRSSTAIPQAHLTKIFRQAAMSGIILDSYKIGQQQAILPKQASGDYTHGELEDMHIYIRDDSEACTETVINLFKKLHFEDRISVEDILIVTARREASALSMQTLNRKIQSLLSFDDRLGKLSISLNGIETVYHVGDRILVTKNNYRTKLKEARDAESGVGEEPIYNGNLGTITKIDVANHAILVNFRQGEIWIESNSLRDVDLGYAITTHRGQGSGFPYVITTFDSGGYTMLTKEWLYTSITRAKKHCYMVAPLTAINRCIAITRVSKKKTWLPAFLNQTDMSFVSDRVDQKDIAKALKYIEEKDDEE